MIRKGDLKFGDIVWTEFDPSVGHEYQNKRPAIIVQSDEQLKISNLATVIPLTSQSGNIIGDDIIIAADQENNLRVDSVAKVYCLTSFDYSRFVKKIGIIGNNEGLLIKNYLRKHFGL
jgi:mRNA-degrading endonuclease toxin of MazEF toxin-antitoxin module